MQETAESTFKMAEGDRFKSRLALKTTNIGGVALKHRLQTKRPRAGRPIIPKC